MNIFKSLKLYKISIKSNRFLILIYFCIFTFSILTDSYVSSKQLNIYELEIVYNNLSLFRQGVLYIPFCTALIIKLLEFMENNFIVVRLGGKDEVCKQLRICILITNFIISIYLVVFSYICALLFTQERYMVFGRTLILLASLVLLYTIALSLFSLIYIAIKMIVGNKMISYIVVLGILVPEVANPSKSIILSGVSFNLEYLSNSSMVFFNILKFVGITMLLFELARIIYKKEEVYNTKTLIGGSNYDN